MRDSGLAAFRARRDRWQALQIAVILVLAMASLARAGLARDLDALAIAGLSLLLARVLWVESRRRQEIDRKLDRLLNLHRYGPLTEEDREVITALRTAGASRPSA